LFTGWPNSLDYPMSSFHVFIYYSSGREVICSFKFPACISYGNLATNKWDIKMDEHPYHQVCFICCFYLSFFPYCHLPCVVGWRVSELLACFFPYGWDLILSNQRVDLLAYLLHLLGRPPILIHEMNFFIFERQRKPCCHAMV
jgi:hypothetical protein